MVQHGCNPRIKKDASSRLIDRAYFQRERERERESYVLASFRPASHKLESFRKRDSQLKKVSPK